MTSELKPSPQIVFGPPSPHDHSRFFYPLPNLAVTDDPGVWSAVIRLLVDRGLSREEALTRVRFAYTGLLDGDLPPGVS